VCSGAQVPLQVHLKTAAVSSKLDMQFAVFFCKLLSHDPGACALLFLPEAADPRLVAFRTPLFHVDFKSCLLSGEALAECL